MSQAMKVLDRSTRVSPMGVRFGDQVTGGLVREGLRVTVARKSNPSRKVEAFPNRSGTWVARGLPGFTDFERSEGDDATWQGSTPAPFVVEVEDAERRFQPFSFEAELPQKGLVLWDCAAFASPISPVTPPEWIPVFSAPTRATPSGMAVLRADLWDVDNDAPAAWAVMTVSAEGVSPVRGVADASGRILVIFPYPPLQDFALVGSPPHPVSAPVHQQTWTLDLAIAYEPRSPVPSLPDLCETLDQATGTIWEESTTPTPLTQVTLRYGEELVIRSSDAVTGDPLSVLLVSAAASP